MFALLASFLLALRPAELEPMLEQNLSNQSIVETRQIEIPGYPNAYNASLISYQNGYLLSFRTRGKFPETAKNPFRSDYSLLGLAKLDPNFNVIADSVQVLNIFSHSPHFSLTAEDGRLLRAGERIFLFFNDLPYRKASGGFAMYFGELIEHKGEFDFKEDPKPIRYSHATPVEKNWSPFTSDGKFYLIYSDQPHVILELDPSTGHAQEVVRNDSEQPWKWGRIRGGTPAYRLGDSLITFFHSVIPARPMKKEVLGLNYVMGAYLFDAKYPFSIQSISPTPLGNTSYYTDNNPIKVVFPCGLVIEDKTLHVVWGKSDKEIFITTFDKKKLLAELK